MFFIREAWVCSLAAGLFAVAIFCAPADAGNSNPHELVLPTSSIISVKIGEQSLIIESTSTIQRKIYLDGCTFFVDLRTRNSRWFGNLGGYNPGFSWHSTNQCKGLSRVVITEGQIHFPNQTLAKEWLRRRPISFVSSYDGFGLSVSWRIDHYRRQISISINLLCIDGSIFRNSEFIGDFSRSRGGTYACADLDAKTIQESFEQIRNSWIVNDYTLKIEDRKD